MTQMTKYLLPVQIMSRVADDRQLQYGNATTLGTENINLASPLT